MDLTIAQRVALIAAKNLIENNSNVEFFQKLNDNIQRLNPTCY